MHARMRTSRRRNRPPKSRFPKKWFPKNKKRKPAETQNPVPWLCARAAALFPTPRNSLTVSVPRWSRGRDAWESMGALSTLTIGNHAPRARVLGPQERLVVAHATGQAGCTREARDSARKNTRQPQGAGPIRWHPFCVGFSIRSAETLAACFPAGFFCVLSASFITRRFSRWRFKFAD